MKKVLFTLAAILGLSLALVSTSCGGGGSDDDDNPTRVSSVSNGITGSWVFIDGRSVTIWARWCSDHEVTQSEYQDVMGINPSNSYGSNKPVEQVSWYDALVYCNTLSIREGRTPCYKINGKNAPSEWGAVPTSSDTMWDDAECDFTANGYRLPTEAEWEYFARGGNLTNRGQTVYSGSSDVESVAWHIGNSDFESHAVKGKAPNSLNLYDMSGNVWEWCWDRYGRIDLDTHSAGATSGSFRIQRGGSWLYGAGYCDVTYRYMSTGNEKRHDYGFRVVSSRSE